MQQVLEFSGAYQKAYSQKCEVSYLDLWIQQKIHIHWGCNMQFITDSIPGINFTTVFTILAVLYIFS